MKANYDLISEQWCNLRKALPTKDNSLLQLFIDRLPKKARILDLGCGHGIPIAKLLDERGFLVTGVDRSANLLQKPGLISPMPVFSKVKLKILK